MVRVIQERNTKNQERQKKTERTLKSLRKKSAEQQAAILAKELGLLYIDLHLIPVNVDDVRLLKEAEAKKYNAVIFLRSSRKIRLATTTPQSKEFLQFVIELEEENGWEIQVYVVSQSSLDKGLAQYHSAFFIDSPDTLGLSLSDQDLENFEQELKDLIKLNKRITEIPTTDIINIILAGGVKMGASDIHLESQEDAIRLRYRIDGILQDVVFFPRSVYKLIVSRIKLMGKMKINLRDIAQDGHFNITIGENEVDVRVSVIPDKSGESIVMRLLNKSSILVDMDQLGLRGLMYEQLRKQAEKSNGLILTTGPTGSGKTTTLYSLLHHINSPETKIITIEDPVEYKVKGITQTEVSKSKGYTFAKGLRAIVRQDPDTILVGEIRDEETADIAVNAALTGHLVLSTLHTNNAAATIPRLFELGIKPTLIPPAVNAFMAQRLVRTLCNDCKEKYVPADETLESIKKMLTLISPKSQVAIPSDVKELYRAAGCPKCHGTGYKGRIGIYEVLTMNESIERLIMDMAGETEIMRQAMEDGMLTMTQDGVLKALEGTTSMEEVSRVTAEGDFLTEMYENLISQSLSRAVVVGKKDFDAAESAAVSFEDTAKMVAGTNQKEVLQHILALALHLKAADIHIEPQEKEVTIRLRLDGVLQTIATIPLTEYPALIGQVKLLSSIKTQVREGVKDSRFRIDVSNNEDGTITDKIDVRVSLILGGFGETVVMRLLNTAAVDLDIEKLGIRKENLKKILHEVKKPYGVFLNTGPTGSGKTTTLYSILRILNDPSVKIITVEDPIEYQLDGILQTQVNQEGGYTFPTALRSLLRQDPDIMMIGEIRDDETATIALQASLTGHLILSTLHTNDAVGSVQRLLNMNVRPDDMITAINAFMAQRLVRHLCDCKKEIPLEGTDKEHLESVVKTISPKTGIMIPPLTHIYAPGGCEKCNNVGFSGRTVVSEVFVLSKELEEMIARGALIDELKEKAMEDGMLTMYQDGVLKVLEGETTLEEIERVTTE